MFSSFDGHIFPSNGVQLLATLVFNEAFKSYYSYVSSLISSRQLSLSALSLPCIVVSVFWSGLSASPPTAAAAATTTAAADFAESEEVHAKCAAAGGPPAGTLSTQDVSSGLVLLEAHHLLKPISAAGQDHGLATATKAAAGWGFRWQLQTFSLPPQRGWWRRS